MKPIPHFDWIDHALCAYIVAYNKGLSEQEMKRLFYEYHEERKDG